MATFIINKDTLGERSVTAERYYQEHGYFLFVDDSDETERQVLALAQDKVISVELAE